jgi:hypothetical protein
MSVKTSLMALVGASLVGVAVFHVSPSRAQSCQHSRSITLEMALSMEARQDAYAAHFPGALGSSKDFVGMKNVPYDLAISNEIRSVRSQFTAAVHTLPSEHSKVIAGVGGTIAVACKVTLSSGNVWYAIRFSDGGLLYFQPLNQ